MTTVNRRFISCVGKVKLSDFEDPSHMALVDKYCNDQETRVSQLPTSSGLLLLIKFRILASNKPLYRELSCINHTKIRPTRRRSSLSSFWMQKEREWERDIFMRTGPQNFVTSRNHLPNRHQVDLSDYREHGRGQREGEVLGNRRECYRSL